MKVIKNNIFSVSLLILLAGCIATPLKELNDDSFVFSKFLRGTVYFEDVTYKFKPCGSSSISIIEDNRFQLARFFEETSGLFTSRYVEFDATATKKLAWKVDKVHFVASQPSSCDEKLISAHYFISGADDHWNAFVDDKQISIKKRGFNTKLVFPALINSEKDWEGNIVLPRGVKYKMKLNIYNKHCVDKERNWYRLSADLLLNDLQYKGCVRKSLPINDFVSGKYSNLLTEDNAFIVLNLQKDEKAKLIFDYRNGHPIVVINGHWSIRSNQTLELVLDLDENIEEQSIMLFQISNNRELKLKGFSDVLGQTGLKLLPVFTQ